MSKFYRNEVEKIERFISTYLILLSVKSSEGKAEFEYKKNICILFGRTFDWADSVYQTLLHVNL